MKCHKMANSGTDLWRHCNGCKVTATHQKMRKHQMEITQWAHTCTENVMETCFQDVQNVYSEDAHKT